MGTAHPSNANNQALFGGILEHTKASRLFSVEHRLAAALPFTPENPFPASLIDAIAGYRYLVNDIGVNPNNIIISGDSSGGNLAHSLVRYIFNVDGHGLRPAGGLLLISPTVDWAGTHDGYPDSSFTKHTRSDFVHSIFTSRYTYRALQGRLPDDEVATNSWISPASLRIKDTYGVFTRFPKTLIIVGGVEMTLDAVRTLRNRMIADMGESMVEYLEVPESTHVFISHMWHEPERTDTLKKIGGWVESL